MSQIKCKIYWNKAISPLSPTAMLFLSEIDQSTLVIWDVAGFILVQLIKMSFVLNILLFYCRAFAPAFNELLITFFITLSFAYSTVLDIVFLLQIKVPVDQLSKTGKVKKKERIQIRSTNFHNSNMVESEEHFAILEALKRLFWHYLPLFLHVAA